MAGYIGTTPVPQATQHRESFTATGGQTSFATVGYTPQFIDVYLNGVKLAPADFTATNGSDVVLASGATASDILEIVAYTPFEIASQTFTGDTTANNFAVTGTFTSRGIDDNADAVAITIDSSENVGIGTSSPSSYSSAANNLVVQDTAGEGGITIVSTNTGSSNIFFADTDAAAQGQIKYQHSGDYMRFYTAASERMRLDSSGNLLVGKTSDNQALAGVKLGTGGSNMSRNNEVLVLNRLSTDGTILNLKKDGATVGSIGTQSGTLQIDGTSGSTGLLFGASNIYPRDNGANSDGGVDIGGSSIRFKDLYLSGGVYLGGTGSANKLTDYEHGFFTPTFGGTTTDPSGVTYDGTVGNEGFYVKVGRAVFIQINIRTDGITNVGDGTLLIKGLPFTSPDQTSQGGVATVAVSQSRDFAGENPSAAYITENATYITPFYRLTADGGSNLSQCSDLGTGLNDNLIRIGGTYYVTV